jgi:hypothetical protein
MWGHEGEDCVTDIGKALSGCGGRGEKRLGGLRKDEGTSQSKLRGMGMMGKWMETRTQLAIRIMLIIGFPSGVY